MREIKFRGRVKNTNVPQWVYGIVIPPQYSSWEDWTLFDGERRWIVNPETVGQFTGICDSAGNEIYEGDILKTNDEIVMYVCFGKYAGTDEITKYRYGFYVHFASKKFNDRFRKDLAFWTDSEWQKIYVIGKVIDNPELLKDGEDDGQ